MVGNNHERRKIGLPRAPVDNVSEAAASPGVDFGLQLDATIFRNFERFRDDPQNFRIGNPDRDFSVPPEDLRELFSSKQKQKLLLS